MSCKLAAALALTCMVLGTGRGSADDERKPEDTPGAEQETTAAQAEMMKQWQELATPGKSHEALRPLAGKWNTVTKMWMAGPEGPAMEFKGTAEYKWILGGRFLRETVEGQLMEMPFSGIGLLGYDNHKKKYTSCWVDSASTSMRTSEGLLDRTGKVLTYYGTMDEWLTGEHDKAVKYVYRIVNDDKHIFEIHDLGIVDGEKENTKVVDITYTRAE